MYASKKGKKAKAKSSDLQSTASHETFDVQRVGLQGLVETLESFRLTSRFKVLDTLGNALQGPFSVLRLAQVVCKVLLRDWGTRQMKSKIRELKGYAKIAKNILESFEKRVGRSAVNIESQGCG